jgi:hypothetical protein
VWWEARVVRIWTWPTEARSDLTDLCRVVLSALPDATSTVPAAGQCAGGPHRVTTLDDICPACTRSVFADLAVDYKCVTLLRPHSNSE